MIIKNWYVEWKDTYNPKWDAYDGVVLTSLREARRRFKELVNMHWASTQFRLIQVNRKVIKTAKGAYNE